MIFGTQISVLPVSGGAVDKDALNRSALWEPYKKELKNVALNPDGCTAIKFLSRKTWVAIGVVMIDEKVLLSNSSGSVNSCVISSLDYINGFPINSEYFSYGDMPDIEIRRLIFKSIYKCSREKKGRAVDVERTRSGITPLPKMSCVIDNIGS